MPGKIGHKYPVYSTTPIESGFGAEREGGGNYRCSLLVHCSELIVGNGLLCKLNGLFGWVGCLGRNGRYRGAIGKLEVGMGERPLPLRPALFCLVVVGRTADFAE